MSECNAHSISAFHPPPLAPSLFPASRPPPSDLQDEAICLVAQAGDELADELACQVQRVEVLAPHLERLFTIQVTEEEGEGEGVRGTEDLSKAG